MSRLANSAAWLVGAVIPVVGYWYVVVYLADEYNHGYGRDTWFQLQLYVGALAIVSGLVGYTIAGFVRERPSGTVGALIAGVAFAVAQLLFAFVLRRAMTDRETIVQELVGALVLGVLSVLVTSLRSPNAR